VELLVADGFGRMSIEGVAARAGVGKATVYRRWATKQDLVVDAVRHRCQVDAVSPDTGSVRGDLIELLRSMVQRFQRDGDVMAAFAAEQGRHPELAEVFRTTFLAERRRVTQEVVRRGMARRQLPPGTDVELVADMGPAIVWHRLTMSGLPLDEDLPERIVAQFLP
jgi:AcrR family transcriptional regulator